MNTFPQPPAADLDRVYRVDKARARRTGGTGLGLAIVRHVANTRRVVSVQAQEGEGSTFAFRLPARLVVAQPSDPGDSATGTESPSRTSARPIDNHDEPTITMPPTKVRTPDD